MKSPRIRHIARLSNPRVSASGVAYTHYLPLSLTTAQAVALSEWFESCKAIPDSSRTELIRSAIFEMVLSGISEERVVALTARLNTLVSLSEKLSQSEVTKAMSFLNSCNSPKEHIPSVKTSKTTPASTVRREYIPPPDYFRKNKKLEV